MDSAESRARSPSVNPVGMCYVVVTEDDRGRAPRDVRVRFEFRSDLASGDRETRTVLGVDDACDTLRGWLERIAG